MIVGAKHYADSGRWHTQENNALEVVLKYVMNQNGVVNPRYLETCGPTSAINCAKMVSDKNLQKINAGYPGIQAEDAVMAWMNNIAHRRALMTVVNIGTKQTPLNRIGQLFPVAMMEMYGITCVFKGWHRTEQMLVTELSKGSALQMPVDNGNHFVAIGAYNKVKKMFIYNDSWQKRPGNKKGGWNEEISFLKLAAQVPEFMSYYIAYEV